MKSKITSRIPFFLIFLLSIIIADSSFSPKTVPTQNSSLFGGIGDNTRSFFQGTSQSLQNWFLGQYYEQQGGSNINEPTSGVIPTTPPDITPTPMPYINTGDLIQLDASYVSSCKKDAEPDDLHSPISEQPEESCDWNLPETPMFDVPPPAECEGNWVQVPITCGLHASIAGVQGSGGGCLGDNSTLSACLIDATPEAEGAHTYRMYWILSFVENMSANNQAGEIVAYQLFADEDTRFNYNTMRFENVPLTERYIIAGYEKTAGSAGASVPGNYVIGTMPGGGEDYHWPKFMGSGTYNCSAGGYMGTCQWGSWNGACTCACDNSTFNNNVPYIVELDPAEGDRKIAVGFQVKTTTYCCGGNCGNTGHPKLAGLENSAIIEIPISEAIPSGQIEPAPEIESLNGAPCDPQTLNGGFQDCENEQLPDKLEGWLDSNTCEFQADWDEECQGGNASSLFKECPASGRDPLDLCWGLHDNQPSLYAPANSSESSTSSVCGNYVMTNKAGEVVEDFTCTYQVPAQNIVYYPAGSCNEIVSLAEDYRMCSTLYAPESNPGIGIGWIGYVRKLNHCNAFIEPTAISIGESSYLGLKGDSYPGTHLGYCDSQESLCNTTDGMRCVSEESGQVCRKAIRVETYEFSHRTTTPPPEGAFTSNCLARQALGVEASCGNEPNCESETYNCPNSNCPDCETDDSSIWPNECNGHCCCDECEADTDLGCNPLSPTIDGCYPTTSGYCDQSLCDADGCTDPNCDSGCGDVDDCCRIKEYCNSPVPAQGEQGVKDSGENAARNCAVYEWTERKNYYEIEYESNSIGIDLTVKNLSSHPVPNIPFDPENINEEGLITVTFEIPEFLDYKGYYVHYPDQDPEDPTLNPIVIEEDVPAVNSHGGTFELKFSPLPGANNLSNGNSVFVIYLDLVPSLIDPSGGYHYEDLTIGSLDDLDYYINSLPSEDRLVNLEFDALWGESRSVELLSFWIGSGVLSTAEPGCKYCTAPCFIDAEASPYGWPNTGVIAQDWGGNVDINEDEEVTWTNPLAEIYGERFFGDANNPSTNPLYTDKVGLYQTCEVNGENHWWNTGIDIEPSGDSSWSPEIFSTHSGYVTFVGRYDNSNENYSGPAYPARGICVEIQNSFDDDCYPNVLTRYCNLAEGSLRVNLGEYVARHQMLGLMGDTGTPGYIHLHYSIRTGEGGVAYLDIPDNNVGQGHPQDLDPHPPIDPPAIDFSNLSMVDFETILDWEEVDDVKKPYYEDDCDSNPYRCNVGNPQNIIGPITPEGYSENLFGTCDLNGYPAQFFCTIRRRGDSVNSCYYKNP